MNIEDDDEEQEQQEQHRTHLIYFHIISIIPCVPKFTVFNLSIEKIMPWDPCSYLLHYINWLRFQRG